MKLLTAAAARSQPFDCEPWAKLATNASREAVSHEGYTADVYQAPLSGDFDRAAEALLAYRIFPAERMRPHICTPNQRVAVGATIVQRVILGPIALESAVRVIELERTPDRAFFAYATLEGHPERGIASFEVTRSGNEQRFEARAWSRSGTWLTVLGRPVSRFLQRALTREAVASFSAGAGS